MRIISAIIFALLVTLPVVSLSAGNPEITRAEFCTSIVDRNPGDTPESTISAMIADEAAIGMINNKTTAVRVIPVIGKDVGDEAHFGGLLGMAPIIKINRFRSDDFIARGGRIPAPINSFKN